MVLRERVAQAVAYYWRARQMQIDKKSRLGRGDQGARSAVTGGYQMYGFMELVTELLVDVGIARDHVFHRKHLELPGFFRPTKEWDLLVVRDGQLIAALEAKSQVGPSFGNNFNNRTEEAMGTALDIWTAYREGTFNKTVRPWLGYVFLLEDCPASHKPVRVAEPHFKVLPEFVNASYAVRYEIFCRKLVRERHYNAAAFLMSDRENGQDGSFTEPGGFGFRALCQVLGCPCGRVQGILIIMDNKALSAEEKTVHRLIQGDAREMSFIPDESVHLVVTSPPYWNLKRYNENPSQLGHIDDYEAFLRELTKVFKECFRVLVPGGRLVCIVGDVCLSRKRFGRHVVVPLHADICVACRHMGFDNLNPIIWHKIANAAYEVENGAKFLGKPYEPNAIIKNDIEFILMQRKPGGYRKPTSRQRELSMIEKKNYDEWFRQFWTITGASTREHPAPFPIELAYRLVRMFSFWGDTVLDPFVGTGTTMVAAMKCHRNSIGIEVDANYCRMTARRLKHEQSDLFLRAELHFLKLVEDPDHRYQICEDPALYGKTRPPSRRVRP